MRTSPTTDAPIDRPGTPGNPGPRLAANPYEGPTAEQDTQSPPPSRR